jgi:AcrR family transcriptional regulator
MYNKCVTEKAAAQQRKFESALQELMKDRLFGDISISELCRYTGMSRKTFYRLYETKADLVYALIDHTIMEEATCEPDPSVGPGELHQFLAFWRSRKDLLDMLQKNQISALLAQQAANIALQETPDRLRLFGLEGNANARDMMLFYLSGFFALVLDWHSRGFDRSIDEVCNVMMELLSKIPIAALKEERKDLP